MPIDSKSLMAETIKSGSHRQLREWLREARPRKVAFFAAELDRDVYYSCKSDDDPPLSPIVKLFLSGLHTGIQIRPRLSQLHAAHRRRPRHRRPLRRLQLPG